MIIDCRLPKRTKSSLASGLMALAWLCAADGAYAAPPQLLDKTIVAAMTVSVNARADDGSFTRGPRHVQRTIYVSSKGRIFVRVARQVGRLSTSRDVAPEESRGAIAFRGSKLVGVLKLPSGAAQMVISFDAAFQSCTLEVLFGREAGRAVKFRGLNGKMYTAEGPFAVSGQSCSVRAGNAFAE
jgi:hypothetical protein